MAVTIEERVLEQLFPVGFTDAVEQDVYGGIAFAVKHGEDEDERAEQHASQS